jgi:uncharacterized protein YydD (DUF2326 family)
MFLRTLNIYKGTKILRSISFKKGMNFIVDNTPVNEVKQSGNSVGKTTVLRLIDYCLGSNGESIWKDSEYKTKENTEVKVFLEENNVEVELEVVDSFDEAKKITLLRRNFLNGRDKKVWVNSEKKSDSELKLFLNKEFFGIDGVNPSFRNMIAKFVRNDHQRMSNTLRYLHQATTDTIYESIHLKLLGINFEPELISEKSRLSESLKTEGKIIDRLTKDFSENALKQALAIIERDIEKLNTSKNAYKISGTDQNLIDTLNETKYQLSRKSEEIAELELKFKLIEESVNELKIGISKTDLGALKAIYENAKVYLSELHKKFEDVITFHNSMVDNKIAYLTRNLEADKRHLEIIKLEQSKLLIEERKLVQELNSIISLDIYNDLIFELNKKFEEKGRKEGMLNQIQAVQKSINEKTNRLEEINNILASYEEELNSKELTFNQFFAEISNELYGEQCILTHNKVNENYKFGIQDLQANKGSGKKKGEIASFDLAYIKFSELNRIKAPKFVLHDSPEDVSINQLLTLVKIANEINGQFVVSVLKDKFLSSEEAKSVIDENKIVELSESNKLFMF